MTKAQIAAAKKEYGTIYYAGNSYLLLEPAYTYYDSRYPCDYTYKCHMVIEDEAEYDVPTVYQAMWFASDEWVEENILSEQGGWIDEGNACDWDHPDEVKEIGQLGYDY